MSDLTNGLRKHKKVFGSCIQILHPVLISFPLFGKTSKVIMWNFQFNVRDLSHGDSNFFLLGWM